jgi:hypothetical protein
MQHQWAIKGQWLPGWLNLRFLQSPCNVHWHVESERFWRWSVTLRILNTRKHNVSETGFGSVLRWRDRWWLRLALSKAPNRVGFSLLTPEDGNRSSFRNVVFSIIYNPRRWTKPRSPVILNALTCVCGDRWELSWWIRKQAVIFAVWNAQPTV